MMCPEPVHEAERALRPLPAGARLRVLATDPASPIDFEAWCFHRGHSYLGAIEQDDWLEITVIKHAAAAQ